ARIDRLAVDTNHAFLARVGVDARVANRERRIVAHADPAQPIEHRLARLERHLVALVARRRARGAAPHLQTSFQCSTLARRAGCADGAATWWLFAGNRPADARRGFPCAQARRA